MCSRTLCSSASLLVVLLVTVAGANADTMVNLNDFFFFPGDPVVISPDGSMATIGELAGVSPIVLVNDPGFGDPEVIFAEIGGIPQTLFFDFMFDEFLLNDDEFGAFVVDSSTGLSVGPAFEFFAQDSLSGTVGFDLSSLIGGPSLGLQFQLTSNLGDVSTESTVEVSNVRLVPQAVLPTPEPSTTLTWLIALGVGCSFALFRRRYPWRSFMTMSPGR